MRLLVLLSSTVSAAVLSTNTTVSDLPLEVHAEILQWLNMTELIDNAESLVHDGPTRHWELCRRFKDGLDPQDLDLVVDRVAESLDDSWLFDASVNEHYGDLDRHSTSGNSSWLLDAENYDDLDRHSTSGNSSWLFDAENYDDLDRPVTSGDRSWLVAALSSELFESRCGDARQAVCLHAAHTGKLQMINLCMSFPGVHDALNSFLVVSSRVGRDDLVRYLLAHFPAYSKMGRDEALQSAAMNGHTQVCMTLLHQGGSDPGAEESRALRLASNKGHIRVVQLLLEDGRADPGAREGEALYLASHKCHIMIVELLLEDGRADPGARENGALDLACVMYHLKVVELLLEDGRVDIGTDERGALQLSIAVGNSEVVELLVQHL
ncbi:MAG: hypothetical protein SGCHY_000345 [Lobulomycetales sp.]